MNILIVGGSGILSTDFTKKVLDEKNQVAIVNRGTRKKFIDERAKLIIADIRKESVDQLRSKINVYYYDVVIDFLSFIPEHVEKMQSILDGNFKQYIFISSATAYIKSEENEVISESNEVGNKNWKYAYEKYLCETYLNNLDINYTIIRPYVTYGDSRIPFAIIPDGYHYTLIERIREGKPIVLLNDGEAICTLTHTKDFAEVLYKLLLNKTAYKNSFNITSSYKQTWKEVYLTMCRILDVEPKYFSVDLNQIKEFMPEFYELLKGDKGTNMIFNNKKVLNAVCGYEFKISLYDGLKDSISFFDNNSDMQGIDFRWDGRVDYMYRKCIQSNSLKCLSLKNKNSNSRALYYIMKYEILRRIYYLLRKVKHKILK